MLGFRIGERKGGKRAQREREVRVILRMSERGRDLKTMENLGNFRFGRIGRDSASKNSVRIIVETLVRLW
ncbi:LOW QUALITY PROTEIN: hypothetical protein PanWU01x14_147660 [Parasponia andersonii]|uniref:Uncharacterized protein n=1 Tax=Parasponia andersonii TaxID=3476 RepID=A0A2P5CJI1_PARAD|nr:LOW QUALITY PROTEIN: hypothetical protein PanWU01x14_147660 [Parasponia andersonii]